MFSQNSWAGLAPGFSLVLLSRSSCIDILFAVCPSIQFPGVTSAEVRGETCPIHGFKLLIPNNLTTRKIIMHISCWFTELSFQLQDELREEGRANPLGIWDLGSGPETWVELTP